MTWSRDALDTIVERVRSNMELRVRDESGRAVDAHSPGTGYTEMAEVMGGIAYELQGRQEYIVDQILIVSASEATLVGMAIEMGIPRIAPKFSTGKITVAGEEGATIPSERVLQHSSGLQVRTTEAVVVAGGTATLPVTAMTTGTLGNLEVGESLEFVRPVAGVDSSGTVAAPGLAGGAGIEPIERLRTRLREHRQQPPMGGKDYDYIAWAKAAHVDVTRVFPTFHENGIGSIVVRFVTEDLATPIPTAAHVTAVNNFMADVKPAGTRAFSVEAPIAKPLDLVFTALSPDTEEVRAAIDAELDDLLRREGKCGGTLLLTHIREAISNAQGEEDFAITLNADFVTAANEFPVLGNTTWPS